MSQGQDKHFPLLFSLWSQRNLIFELTRREFTGRYKGSIGGVIWSFIHPLFLLAVYTIAFGVILQVRWGESQSTSDYALMLFAGLIVYNAASELLSKASMLITANPNYVKKIVFPLDLLPVILVLTVMVHACIGIAVWFLGYIFLSGIPRASAMLFPLVLVCLVPILLGLGWLLSALGVFLKDINQLTTMLAHALLFLTPIFYSTEAAPPGLRKLLLLNPLTFVVEQLRQVLFYGQLPAWYGLLTYFVLASIFAWLALALFRRLRPSFSDMV